MTSLSPEFGGYTGQGTVLDAAAGPRFIKDTVVGVGKGLVNFVPETAAFAYRMTGYAAAGVTSLFNTDASDRMFAQYGRVSGTVLSYEGNSLQEAAGLGASFFGPQAVVKTAQLTSRGLFALEAGITDSAAKLRSLGIPDWSIGVKYQPGVLHSNPLPLTFERVGGSPLPSGVGGTGANYDKATGQGLYVLFDEAGAVRYVGRGDAPARIGVHEMSVDKGDLIGRVLWTNNLTKAQAKGLEQGLMDRFGGALRQNPESPLLNVFRSYSPMNPNAATYREAVTPELWQATLNKIGG